MAEPGVLTLKLLSHCHVSLSILGKDPYSPLGTNRQGLVGTGSREGTIIHPTTDIQDPMGSKSALTVSSHILSRKENIIKGSRPRVMTHEIIKQW